MVLRMFVVHMSDISPDWVKSNDQMVQISGIEVRRYGRISFQEVAELREQFARSDNESSKDTHVRFTEFTT